MPDTRLDPTAAPSSGPGSLGAVSPTGQAIIPARFVPYALLLWSLLGGGGLAMLPEGKATQIGGLVWLALGVALGMGSPGLRKKE